MNRRTLSALSSPLNQGAFKTAGAYLIIGSSWILLSDWLAEKIALDEKVHPSMSLYKEWGYVLITTLLLYWLIRRYTDGSLDSEKQLHVVINALPALISYVDASRRYQFTNEAYQEWFGETAQGKHIEEVLGQAAYQKILKYVDKALNGETVYYETEIPYQDGGERFVNATYIPDIAANGQVKGFFAFVQDLSDQRETKEKLRQWGDAFEGCAHGIAIDDPTTNRIMVCNPAFAKMQKCRVEDMVGRAVLSLYAPSDHELVRRYVAKADQIGHTRYEANMIRKDGTIFPVQIDVESVLGEDGELLHRVVTGEDISERRRAEKILQDSEERYRMVSELTSDYAYKDRVEADGSIIPEWFTESFTRITGYTLEETGTPEFWQRLLYPEDFPNLLQHTQKILSGQPDSDEFRVITKNGEMRWLRDFANPVWDAGHQRVVGLYGAVQDFTEHKRAQEKLKKSEERYRYLFENHPYPMWIYDRKTLAFLDVNEAAVLKYGYTHQEFLNMTIIDIRPPEDVERLMNNLAQPRQPLERSDGWRHRLKDGSIIHVEITSHTIEIDGHESALVIAQDITERVQTEQALQKAHAELEIKIQERTAALSQANTLLQALMDYMPDQIYFKDRQSRFIRNSRSQADLLGLSDPTEAIGKTDFDFFPHAAKAYAEEQEVMRSGKSLVDFEEWVVWPDGRETWVSTTKVPLRNSDGETIGIFGISRDITERKRAEQAIRQLNNDLEKQAEQLQAANKELEAFSYSVSHDLRAPLRAIDGYTRILVEDYEANLDEEGKRVCGVISAEARRMGQLIDDLLAFSRLGRKEMYSSKIDMEALAASVFNELIKAEERERIDFQIATLPAMKGDTSLIRQVWINLLANAIKFTSKKDRAVIEVGSQLSKDELIYYVHDNGAGFDMEYANKLFGVFQRLHSENEFDGTGVGLAIVQRIIRRHSGRVWAEGEVEKGATFYFALPRKENHHD
jgi:PAS domain S-box-containing protein